jgi:hypothetical protein
LFESTFEQTWHLSVSLESHWNMSEMTFDKSNFFGVTLHYVCLKKDYWLMNKSKVFQSLCEWHWSMFEMMLVRKSFPFGIFVSFWDDTLWMFEMTLVSVFFGIAKNSFRNEHLFCSTLLVICSKGNCLHRISKYRHNFQW